MMDTSLCLICLHANTNNYLYMLRNSILNIFKNRTRLFFYRPGLGGYPGVNTRNFRLSGSSPGCVPYRAVYIEMLRLRDG